MEKSGISADGIWRNLGGPSLERALQGVADAVRRFYAEVDHTLFYTCIVVVVLGIVFWLTLKPKEEL
jgi:hypothetical protein